jgi:hypothetical protein
MFLTPLVLPRDCTPELRPTIALSVDPRLCESEPDEPPASRPIFTVSAPGSAASTNSAIATQPFVWTFRYPGGTITVKAQ